MSALFNPQMMGRAGRHYINSGIDLQKSHTYLQRDAHDGRVALLLPMLWISSVRGAVDLTLKSTMHFEICPILCMIKLPMSCSCFKLSNLGLPYLTYVDMTHMRWRLEGSAIHDCQYNTSSRSQGFEWNVQICHLMSFQSPAGLSSMIWTSAPHLLALAVVLLLADIETPIFDIRVNPKFICQHVYTTYTIMLDVMQAGLTWADTVVLILQLPDVR